MLFTKSIIKEVETDDGIRISVMSRHTLNDGITPDMRIKHYDMHIPILGPSPKLIGDHYKRNLAWPQFELRYLEEMNQEPQKSIIWFICRLAIVQNVTLLCIEDTCEHCHRRLLAQLCKDIVPQLTIKHR